MRCERVEIVSKSGDSALGPDAASLSTVLNIEAEELRDTSFRPKATGEESPRLHAKPFGGHPHTTSRLLKSAVAARKDLVAARNFADQVER